MEPKLTIFIIFFSVFPLKGERKFLKIENCTADDNVARITTCEIKDGVLSAGMEILKPQNEFIVGYLVGNYLFKKKKKDLGM